MLTCGYLRLTMAVRKRDEDEAEKAASQREGLSVRGER